VVLSIWHLLVYMLTRSTTTGKDEHTTQDEDDSKWNDGGKGGNVKLGWSPPKQIGDRPTITSTSSLVNTIP
jgi:hypothetical protein